MGFLGIFPPEFLHTCQKIEDWSLVDLVIKIVFFNKSDDQMDDETLKIDSLEKSFLARCFVFFFSVVNHSNWKWTGLYCLSY